MYTPIKYPHTDHWIHSPTVHRDDSYHPKCELFLNTPIAIYEKLDGSNTSLLDGKVYGRSVLTPSNDGWRAMVKKHHAWKTRDESIADIQFFGEDIYGIHSIKYNPVRGKETFYLFAAYSHYFQEWLHHALVEAHGKHMDIKSVPKVYHGVFTSINELTDFLNEELKKLSALGGPREGFVIEQYAVPTIHKKNRWLNKCKFVRANHVQTKTHWTKNWEKCEIIR